MRRLSIRVAQFNAAVRKFLFQLQTGSQGFHENSVFCSCYSVHFDDVAFVVSGDVIGHVDPPSFAPTAGVFKQQTPAASPLFRSLGKFRAKARFRLGTSSTVSLVTGNALKNKGPSLSRRGPFARGRLFSLPVTRP